MAAAACLQVALILAGAAVTPNDGEQDVADVTCETCGVVRGVVKTAALRTPVADASVLMWPVPDDARTGRVRRPMPPEIEPAWVLSTRTDEDGAFVLEDVPGGKVGVAIVAAGHERVEHVVEVGPDPQVLKIFAKPDDASAYRTVVRSKAEARAQAKSEILSREEIATLPGSQGDPLRALQNLPGVARVPGGLGLLILRGAAPGQSRVFMGGHAMPRAFHFLSLASVFPADILDELEFVPGNFDAAYGNTSGGIVRIEPRKGRRDGFHGYGGIDLTAAGTTVEGPLGKGSFIVGGQRGYVDAVLLATERAIEAVTGDSTPYLFPSYWDYHGMFDHPVGRASELSVRVFGAGDRLYARAEVDTQTGTQEAGFDFAHQFHRVDLVYRTRQRGWEFNLTPSFRFEQGSQSNRGLQDDRRRRDYVGSLRAEASKRVTRRFSILVGADAEVDRFDVRVDPRAAPDPTSGMLAPPPEGSHTTYLASSTGVYATGDLGLGMVTLRPGVRASGFTLGSQGAFAFDPRFVMHVDPNDLWRVSVGIGRYSQALFAARAHAIDLVSDGSPAEGGRLSLPPVIARLDPQISFDTVETARIPLMQATHVSLGVTRELGRGWSAGATAFARDQHDGDPVAIDGITLNRETRSRAVGLEAIVRKRMTDKLYGWIAYTLMHAQIRSLLDHPGIAPTRAFSDFDQRHNLVFVLSYLLPRQWRIGGRFRVTSGYPFTPVVGTIRHNAGVVPVYGHYNGARLPAFHQLDLRIDKSWILRRARVTWYFDVQNVYNRQNPEAAIYSVDYREQLGFVGLPIFPSLGLRVDY
jgi:hypothetical protein